MSIFPNLPKRKWGRLNLDDEARKVTLDFTDPLICAQWIEALHINKSIKYSYGGFLEDRSHLWAEHYQKDSGAFIHLGTDYVVPINTKLTLPLAGRIVHVMRDEETFGGWGCRVLWKLNNGNYLIYGHLKNNISLERGKMCEPGLIVGETGVPSENGGWFPHLHVQYMSPKFILAHSNLNAIDGYLTPRHPHLELLLNPDEIINPKKL